MSASRIGRYSFRVKNRPIFIEARDLPDADGTLASDILRDYDVEVDFAGGDISLISPDYCTVTSTAVIAMDVAQNGHVRFPLKIDGKTIIATLDTGSATSLISIKAAVLLGIDPNSPGLALVRDTGQYQIYAYPFHSLDFRGVLVKNPHIAIVSEGFIPGSESDLVLGMDVLRQLHFTIAYRDRRLFISPMAAN
jgi:predicted aspartyl protease